MSSKVNGCVFCAKLDPQDDHVEHVLLRGQTAYITLNRFPYNNGHLLIVPYAHVPSLEDLPAETLTEMMLLVNRGLSMLRQAMRPDGFNVGVNLGKAAGAGIECHVHIHVLPRWNGDTSFMATISETRTIPEALDQTYDRLLSALRTLHGASPERN